MSLPIDKYLVMTKEEGFESNKRRIRVVVKDWDGALLIRH